MQSVNDLLVTSLDKRQPLKYQLGAGAMAPSKQFLFISHNQNRSVSVTRNRAAKMKSTTNRIGVSDMLAFTATINAMTQLAKVLHGNPLGAAVLLALIVCSTLAFVVYVIAHPGA